MKSTRVSDVHLGRRHAPSRAGTARRSMGAIGHGGTRDHGGRRSGAAPQGSAGDPGTGPGPARRRRPAPTWAYRSVAGDAMEHASGLDAGGPWR